MSWVATAVVGAAVIGGTAGVIGAGKAGDAAESAAQTQAGAADRASETQLEMFNLAREDYSPYRELGLSTLNSLSAAAGAPTKVFDQAGYDKAVADWQSKSKAAGPGASDMLGEGFGPNQELYQSDPKYKQAYDNLTAWHQSQYGTTPASDKGSDLDTWRKQIADAYGIGSADSVPEPNRDDFYTGGTKVIDPFAKERALFDWPDQGDFGAGTLSRIGGAGSVEGQRAYINKLQNLNPNIKVDLSGQRGITSQLGAVNTSAARDLSAQEGFTRKVGEIDPLAAQNYDRAQGYITKADALNPNITFDENSPYFQASKSELMRTLNNRMAAQGLSGSSTSEDAIIRNILPLIEQEYGRQEGNYTRSLGQYGQLYGMETGLGGIRYGEKSGDIAREAGLLGQQFGQQQSTDQMGYTQGAGDIDREMAKYGQMFGQTSATDTFGYNVDSQNYDRSASQIQNLYNMRAGTDATQFGNLTTQYGLEQGADTDAMNRRVKLFELENLLNNQGYSRQLDLAKIGAGAATSAGNAALQTGQNIGNLQTASGAAIASGQAAAGAQQANMWSNLGSLPLQAYGQYQMTNALNNYYQPPKSYPTGSDPYGSIRV